MLTLAGDHWRARAFDRQWSQRRPVQLREQAVTGTFALLERMLVELVQQFADGAVQLPQGEELAMP